MRETKLNPARKTRLVTSKKKKKKKKKNTNPTPTKKIRKRGGRGRTTEKKILFLYKTIWDILSV